MAEAGSGALASCVANSKPQMNNIPTDASATAWILNDDPFGTMFTTCSALGLSASKVVDARLLQGADTCIQGLLADHASQKPTYLVGILKAPPTHVGTKLTRQFSQGLCPLLRGQLRCQTGIVLVGPRSSRYLDAPGI